MAKSIEEILGKPINSVKELRNELNSLRDSLIGLDQESQEYADTEKKIAAAQNELNNVTRAGKDIYVGATDSIKGMEAEYRKLYATYSQLTEAERNSAFGKETAAQLKTMSDKLNETKQGVGNFKDNIGRYTESITKAFQGMGVSLNGLKGPLGIATTGMKGFNAVVKANPIGLIVTAISLLIGVFQKMREAIGANEEKQMKLNQIMARFQPIIDGVKNGLDALADTFLKIVDWASKAATAVRRFFASDKEAFDAEQKAYQDLAKAQNEYTKQKRINKELNAKDNATVKALEEEASATENAKEKQRLLTEAKDKQAEIDARLIAEAEEHLRILEAEAALTANDAAANEALADAKAAVANATAQADANAKRFNRQIQATTRSMRSAAGSAKNLRDEAKKIFEDSVEQNKTELQKLDEKYKKEYELLKKYGFDTTNLTKNYEKSRTIIIKEEAKKQSAIIESQINERVNNISRDWQNQKSLAETASQRFWIDAEQLVEYYNLLIKKQTDFQNIIESASGDYKVFWDYVLNNADLKQIDSFDYMKEFLSVFTTETSPEDIQKIIKVFNEIIAQVGEAGWEAATRAMAEIVRRFNSEVGIDIKNLPDFEARIADTGKAAAESFGNAFITNVKEAVTASAASLNDIAALTFQVDDSPEMFQKFARARMYVEATQLEAQKELLEKELEDFSGTTEQKLELTQQYYDVVEKLTDRYISLEELSAERTVGIWDAAFDSINNVTNSINSMISTYSTLMQAEIQSGKLTESECKKKEKALKKLAAIQLAVSIANITASNAAAIMDVWRGYSAEMPVNAETAAAAGPAAAGVKAALDAKSLTAAILKTVGISANAIAQLAAARGSYISTVNNLQSDSAGGTASVASVSTIDSAPFTYTRTVQTAEEQDALNRPIYVSVVDIEDKLNEQKVKVTETHF